MKRVTPLFAVVALGVGGGTAAAERAPATPRTLPTGAPACGNTQGKGPARPCATTVAKVLPRTLPTGAPACGNVLSKVDHNAADPLYLACIRGDEPARLIVNKMVMSRVLKLLGVSTTPIAVTAKPRVLRNGSPANGNLTGRMAPSEHKPVEQPTPEPHSD